MSDGHFFDTNVLIYANSLEDIRSESARQLLLNGGVVNVQVLNEFASVARAKLAMTWDEVKQAVESILLLCPNPRSLDIETHRQALELSRKYRFSIWDSLIVVAAKRADCSTLLTEDLQHGQIIDGLRIENPFLGL